MWGKKKEKKNTHISYSHPYSHSHSTDQPQIDLSRTPYEVKGWVDNESNMTCHWDAFPSPRVRWTRNKIPLVDGVNATIETEVVVGGVITILYVSISHRNRTREW